MGDPTTTATSERPYDFIHIYRLACWRQGKRSLSDKDLGGLLGISERRVRNARLEGMDEYTADEMAVRLGFLPILVFGSYDWVTPESLFTDDLRSGVIEPSDVLPLYRSRAWEDSC
jgi:hypothetical protein